MATGKKRSNSKNPIKNEGNKRVRTDSNTNVAIKKEPNAASSFSLSASTAIASSINAAAETHEPASLCGFTIAAQGIANVIKFLEKIQSANKEDSNYNHPVIIGQAIDLIANEQNINSIDITLIKQPLNTHVINRRPLSEDIKQRIATLPKYLYKMTGENKKLHIKFEIEIAANDQEFTELSSASQLLKLCHTNEGSVSYINFSLGSSKSLQCIVAPVLLLEALKSSHIYWPAYFAKHIADLHTFRAVLAPLEAPSSTANIGIFAGNKKPLTPPIRLTEVIHFLLARTVEVEVFRGTSGAHINLNVSNEDCLGRDDDLFVTRHIPHDDVHAPVMYGETPIYDGFKTDKSKAMVSKDLFEKAAYEKQIHCVKEEAMVISLERFLLPKLMLDPDSAYCSALPRICTTLTKDWFRQFAVDFPRLAVCDKNLIPIRDVILEKHPLLPVIKDEPLELSQKTMTDLDNLHIMRRLISMTKLISSSNKLLIIEGDEDDDDSDEDDDSEEDVYKHLNNAYKLRSDKSFG